VFGIIITKPRSKCVCNVDTCERLVQLKAAVSTQKMGVLLGGVPISAKCIEPSQLNQHMHDLVTALRHCWQTLIQCKRKTLTTGTWWFCDMTMRIIVLPRESVCCPWRAIRAAHKRHGSLIRFRTPEGQGRELKLTVTVGGQAFASRSPCNASHVFVCAEHSSPSETAHTRAASPRAPNRDTTRD